MEIVIASVICSIMVSAVTSIIITREYMSVTQNEVDRMFNMSIKLVEDVAKMMADIVYRMAEKSVDEASAWYEYQPEVPEKLKKRNSCKLVSKRSTK